MFIRKELIVKSLFISFIFMVMFMLFACQSPESSNQPSQNLTDDSFLKGEVQYVIDGDTFEVKLENGDSERVRAILVNTPETCHKSSPADCQADPYGEEAADFTRKLLDGQTVYLEQDVEERDSYDRMLAYVYLEDGSMYQELILEEGLAEIMAIKPNIKYQSSLESIEQKAKTQHLNLWSD
jgi:micrococcal nuclease